MLRSFSGNVQKAVFRSRRKAILRSTLIRTAFTQTIGWGTLFILHAHAPADGSSAGLEPCRAERRAFTLGILLSGVLGILVGRWVDRHGGQIPPAAGAVLGAAMLASWAMVDRLWVFYLIWFGMGVAHATASGPAMAVVVALARHPLRVITAITFITGFTGPSSFR